MKKENNIKRIGIAVDDYKMEWLEIRLREKCLGFEKKRLFKDTMFYTILAPESKITVVAKICQDMEMHFRAIKARNN